MKVFRGSDSPFRAADVNTFSGSAETKLLAASDGDVPINVYHVGFDAGARTHWHIHTGPQWLLITEGSIRVQSWGEAAHDLSVGDAVVFAPGEKHWHGAVGGTRGVHLAINVKAKTEWLEPVSEADYLGR
jgi:quercetin dioxygenase-like cupin family protein